MQYIYSKAKLYFNAKQNFIYIIIILLLLLFIYYIVTHKDRQGLCTYVPVQIGLSTALVLVAFVFVLAIVHGAISIMSHFVFQ